MEVSEIEYNTGMKYAQPEWRNGQPYSPEFEDVYFSADNGVAETEHVFLRHNQLFQRFAQCGDSENLVIAETGFGSGLNFLVSVKHWLQTAKGQSCLYYYAIENTPFRPEDLARAHQQWPALQPVAAELQRQYQAASQGFHLFELFDGRVKLILMLGEVETMLRQMQAAVDAWYLDGFAPGRNPQMWCDGVFKQIARLSHRGTTFSTYTAAGAVRRGLSALGFEVEKPAGCGNKRHMLRGTFTADKTGPGADSEQPWYALPRMPLKPPSVTIIGAGIAGLSSAWALVRRGYRVDIIEAGSEPGAQASGNPRGMLMPRLSLQDSADGEFYLAAYFYALRCLQQLDSKQQVWQQTGGMQLPASPRVRKQMAEYPQDPALAEVLDAERASQMLGLKVDQPVHYFPLAACVYPQKILRRLIEAMGDALQIRYNCSVSHLDYDHEQWQLKNARGELIHSSRCLLLASAWQTRRFAAFKHLHLQPARGQLSLLRASEQSRGLRMAVSYGGYLLPESESQHVLGASFELDDCANDVRNSEHRANLADLDHWFRGLFSEQQLSGGRASARAVTPDRVPIVGPAPAADRYLEDYGDLFRGRPARHYPAGTSLPGLYVNTGHGARGFSSAFLSAELIAACIDNEALPVSNRVRYALHPARFLIRTLKKKKT